jgi:hypothetical protein
VLCLFSLRFSPCLPCHPFLPRFPSLSFSFPSLPNPPSYSLSLPSFFPWLSSALPQSLYFTLYKKLTQNTVQNIFQIRQRRQRGPHPERYECRAVAQTGGEGCEGISVSFFSGFFFFGIYRGRDGHGDGVCSFCLSPTRIDFASPSASFPSSYTDPSHRKSISSPALIGYADIRPFATASHSISHLIPLGRTTERARWVCLG